MRRAALMLMATVIPLGCGGAPCSSANDCEQGFYCLLSVGSSGSDGTCERDCVSPEDCESGDADRTFSFCSAQGRCESRARPPHLKILEPENDSLLAEGTRKIRLSGEVDTFEESVEVEVTASSEGCLALGRRVTIPSPSPGTLVKIPFLLDDVELDPGRTKLSIEAIAGSARDRVDHLLEIPCPGCAKIGITNPSAPEGHTASTPGLELPVLSGNIEPTTVRTAVWRVRSELGDVMDGRLAVSNGQFFFERIPLFAGRNRLEVSVSGVGSGLGENRCSTSITAGVPSESGLRVLVTWDSASSDVDIHLVGSGGTYLEPGKDLFSRSPPVNFGAQVFDDYEGFGPEVVLAPSLPDGTYGLVAEAFTDGTDSGSNTFIRVLNDGRLLFPGAAGPKFLTVRDQKLWVVGKIIVAGGQVDWEPVDEMVSSLAPPTTPPETWPTFR